jgi:hypothetical protein
LGTNLHNLENIQQNSWRLTSPLRTTRSLTAPSATRFEFRLRVCAARPCVGVPRRFKENRVRHGLRSGGTGGVSRGFGEAGQTFGGGRISAFANNDDVVKRYRTLGTVVED